METTMQREIICLEWKPFERNTLRGFARIKVPSWHITIYDVAVHERDGKRWCQLPARPMLDSNRELIREDGKLKYARMLEFDDRAVGDRFSAAAIKAIDDFIAAGKRVDEGVF
jgi:hypothetical protein